MLKTLDPKACIGYDIGCTFLYLVLNSSLGDLFRSQKYRVCVDAFHGYSHNFACQSRHHPSIIKGAGLEDFAGMERIFSASNAVAPVTRYASSWHRRSFIDLFCHQWDEEKYVNLGTMLLNNYCQALTIIDDEPALIALAQTFGATPDDLDRWEIEEVQYMDHLERECPYNPFHMSYIEALRSLREAQ